MDTGIYHDTPLHRIDLRHGIVQKLEVREDRNNDNIEENFSYYIDLYCVKELDPTDAYSGEDDNTGHKLWLANYQLLCFLFHNHSLIFNKKILEVGSGAGLISSSLLKYTSFFNPKCIVCTDGNPNVVALASKNIHNNKIHPQSKSLEYDCNIFDSSVQVNVGRLRWDNFDDIEQIESISGIRDYDVILASDVIYSVSMIFPLLKCINYILEKRNKRDSSCDQAKTVFILSYTARCFASETEVWSHFSEAMKNLGLTHATVQSTNLHRRYNVSCFDNINDTCTESIMEYNNVCSHQFCLSQPILKQLEDVEGKIILIRKSEEDSDRLSSSQKHI